MSIENVTEYSKQDALAASLIESDADFQKFCSLPLIADLAHQDAMVLFSCMTRKTFAADAVIYQAGEEAEGRMYLILDGKVNVKSESGYQYSNLKQGGVFGLFSFLDEKRNHSATLTVERDVVALILDRTYFNLIALEEPKLGNQLMQFMFSLLSKKASELEVEYSHMHNFAFGGKV